MMRWTAHAILLLLLLLLLPTKPHPTNAPKVPRMKTSTLV
jgi:hypothetical protein